MDAGKFLIASAILVAVIRVTNAAATATIVGPSPDDPNKCFRSEDKLTLAVGEEKQVADCSVIICQKSRSKLMLMTMSCGAIGKIKGCRQVVDISKPYPGCCPQLVCD